jgi:signal transduction histidine kinase
MGEKTSRQQKTEIQTASSDRSAAVSSGREARGADRKRTPAYPVKADGRLEAMVRQRTSELERSNGDLRLLASRLTLAEEHERRRIAREMHDRIGQSMTLCSVQIARLVRSSTSEALTGRLKEIQATLKDILDETRWLIFETSPGALYDFGLEMALRQLMTVISERRHVSVSYEDDGRPKPLDEDAKVLLFHMIRELLTSLNDPKAGAIAVKTARRGNAIRITVQNEGAGSETNVPGTATSAGVGLSSIGERLKQIGGSARVVSRTGGGTTVTILAPLKQV